VLGRPLVWLLLPGKKSCRVRHELTASGYADAERWPEIIIEAVEAMVLLEEAIRPYLKTVT